MKPLSLLLVLSLFLCIIFGFTVVSVEAATLNITVADTQTGNRLNGVSITVTPETGDAATGVSDASGAIAVADLAAGDYTITASSTGYVDKVVADVALAADETKSIEIALSSEVIQLEQVSVTASRRREKVLEAPASVALVGASEIKDRVAPSVTEHLKSVRAVDVVSAGLGASYVVVRGFNNVFSGSLLSLVDNRIASVPSLRVNSYSLIPTASEDIEQIEIVSGPGAALYGPNSANGVMHIITRSPFTSQGTTVSIGGGERRFFTGSLRHAGVINETIGYKVTGNYNRGDDWQDGRAKEDIEGVGEPDFNTYRAGGEFRVDYRPSNDTTAILASGFTQMTNIELTGIGAGQAKNWSYGYLQGRFIYKDLFVQAFWNRSDAGDTYLLRTGQPTIDKSDLYVAQIQHGYSFGTWQRFTYGLDVLLTRPDTEGSINGKNEEHDNLTEVGVYLQSETKILPQLKLIAAVRMDEHHHRYNIADIDDIVLSPRLALAFQPKNDHNFRVTYNRAFNTPGTSNLFLDILSAEDPFGVGIDIRAAGVPSITGFEFGRSVNDRPLFRSPFLPAGANYISFDDPVSTSPAVSRTTYAVPEEMFIPLDHPVFTNVMWNVGRGAVMRGVKPVFEAGLTAQGLPEPIILALSDGFENLIPKQVTGVKNVLRSLDPKAGKFVNVDDVKDVDPLKPTITQTYEVGYKGILMNRLAFSVDVYHSRINDFVGPLVVETPNVFLDAETLGASLGEQITVALADPQNAQLKQALLAFDAPAQGGNGNGSPVDELVKLFVAGTENNGAAFIPYGTVTPIQAADPYAIMLTYRNYGDISLNGLDLSFTYYFSPSLSLGANYSFVNKNLFEDVDGLGDIALNAPKNKFGANVQYVNTDLGLGVGLRTRFVAGFPVRSGVYVGDIESYYTIDLNAGYEIPIGPRPRLSFTVQNLLDHRHQQFVGAPEIGRLSMVRLTQTF